MNRLLLLIGGLGLLLVNLLFVWLNPAASQSGAAQAVDDEWRLVVPADPVRVKPEDLIATGVWGGVPSSSATQQDAAASGALVDTPEAQQLRQLLRGIVRQGGESRVLIEQGSEVVAVGIGKPLVGTRWQVVEIYPDRLLLRDGEQRRSLLLFPLSDEAPEL